MPAYYNEIDPFCVEWLRNLIAAGHIAPGDVDDRSIEDVSPDDLARYEQCHFFAGIAGWSLALRLAGWPDDRPVWTGSVPCQPLSSAGRQQGHVDERHLWPALFRLIAERRPPTVFGEQVASALGREWLAGVRADLEQLGYACGGADLPAASVGAPHIRQRLWWVASWMDNSADDGAEFASEAEPRRPNDGIPRTSNTDGGLAHAQCSERRPLDHARRDAGIDGVSQGQEGSDWSRGSGEDGGLVHPNGRGRAEGNAAAATARHGPSAGPTGGDGGVGDSESEGREVRGPEPGERTAGNRTEGCAERPWDNSGLIPCADAKARRVEPGIQPLAHGVPGRVGRLRAYGNAIVPILAARFIEAARDVT